MPGPIVAQQPPHKEEEEQPQASSPKRPRAPSPQPPPPSGKPSPAVVLSLPCRRVRLFDATTSEETTNDDSSTTTTTITTSSVLLTDYPPDGPSILEVTSSVESQPFLTIAVGYRLAFCLVGDAAVQLLVIESGRGGRAGGAVGDVEKSCRIELESQAAADRLYRSLLLRVNRLFMESSGMLNGSS